MRDISLTMVDEASSTNDLARVAAEGGALHGAVFVARRQTGGRGRSGRAWATLPGALAMSVVLRPSWPASLLPQLTLAAGVATAEALAALTGVRVALKWPNDLLLEGRKLGGILCEAFTPAGGSETTVIAGIGVNLIGAREELPASIEGIATTLEAHGVESPEVEGLARSIATELLSLIMGGAADQAAEVRRRWRDWAALPAALQLSDGAQGEAIDIDDLGRLCVRIGGATRVVQSGEVTWL